jgi:hypothetical protein
MIRPLRKRHLFIWRLLAFLLPAGIIIAWLSIPKQSTEPLLQPEATTPLPVVLCKAENNTYSVSIRSNADTSKIQLEWINKKTLEYPTATIYAGREKGNIKDARLIGRIEARGIWYFPLDSTFKNNSGSKNLVLYDFIHQHVIDNITLKP